MEENAVNPEEKAAYQLAKYNRKTHLFIIDQSCNKRRMGAQTRKMKNVFRNTGISPINWKTPLEIQTAQKEQEKKWKAF